MEIVQITRIGSWGTETTAQCGQRHTCYRQSGHADDRGNNESLSPITFTRQTPTGTVPLS